MINLRKALVTILKEEHSRVYFQRAPINATFPYVVYDLPNAFDNNDQDIYNFDIDIWDNAQDSTTLETLASTMWKKFNKYHYIDEDIQFSVYRDNRLPPLDEDKTNIIRRKLIFQLRYFDRN